MGPVYAYAIGKLVGIISNLDPVGAEVRNHLTYSIRIASLHHSEAILLAISFEQRRTSSRTGQSRRVFLIRCTRACLSTSMAATRRSAHDDTSRAFHRHSLPYMTPVVVRHLRIVYIRFVTDMCAPPRAQLNSTQPPHCVTTV